MATLRSQKGGVLVVSGRAGQGRTTGIMGLPDCRSGFRFWKGRETKRDENPYMA